MIKRIISIVLIVAMTSIIMLSGTPKIDTHKYFYLKLKLEDYVTLGEYKGLEINLKPEIKDDQVDEEVRKILSANTEITEIKDRPVVNGDTVNIFITVYIDGKLDEMIPSDEAIDLEIGSGDVFKDFEDGLIGVTPGQTKTLDLVFPDNLSKEYASKPARFEVKVNYIADYKIPEFNDEFVVKVTKSQYGTAKEYYESIRKGLEETAAEEAVQNKVEDLWYMVLDNCTVIKYPEKEVEDYKNGFIEYYTYNTTLEDFLAQYGLTEEAFYKDAEMVAKNAVLSNLACAAIAKNEGISLNESEYQKNLELIADSYSATPEAFEEENGATRIYMSILNEKVMNYVAENAIEIN